MVFYAKTPCINYATVFYWRLSVHIVGILSVFEVDEMTDAKLSPFHTNVPVNYWDRMAGTVLRLFTHGITTAYYGQPMAVMQHLWSADSVKWRGASLCRKLSSIQKLSGKCAALFTTAIQALILK